MSKTWSELFPGFDEPVLGSSEAYDAAQKSSADLRDNTQACSEEFKRIAAGQDSGQMNGQAADQLATLVKGIDGSFHELPGVFTTVSTIFSDHATKLEKLKQEAASALARANTRWNAVQSAETAHDNARSTLANIDQQIQSLPPSADPIADEQEQQQLNRRRNSAASDVLQAHSRLNGAKADLELSRKEHATLSEQEATLVEETAGRLRGVDLGALDDPSALVAFVTAVGSWGYNLVADVVKGAVELVQALVDALLTGNWGDLLWRLSEFLDAAIKLLVIVVVVLVVVGALFCPALLAVVPALVTTLNFLTRAKAVVDVVLFLSQAPHPETGQPMSPFTAAMSVLGAALTFKCVNARVTGALNNRLQPLIARGTANLSGVTEGALLDDVVGLQGLVNAGNPTTNVINAGFANSEIVASRAAPNLRLATQALLDRRFHNELLTETLVDFGVDRVSGRMDSRVNDWLAHPGLTTDVDKWGQSTGIGSIAVQSPMTNKGLDKISQNVGALLNLCNTGVSNLPNSPGYPVVCVS